MNTEELSYILSIISLIFYSIVYIPQFIEIYVIKKSDGISLWTLLLWTQADILSLVGSILLYLQLSIIIIGWYHSLVGILMTLFVLYYKSKKSIRHYSAVCIFVVTNLLLCTVLNIYINEPQIIVGNLIAWITMVLYLIGRIPQIILNYKNKSTKGLSLLMYLFTILGNGFYIGVITVEPEYISENLPWIVSGVLNIVFDFYVLGQMYYYKNSSNDLEYSEELSLSHT